MKWFYQELYSNLFLIGYAIEDGISNVIFRNRYSFETFSITCPVLFDRPKAASFSKCNLHVSISFSLPDSRQWGLIYFDLEKRSCFTVVHSTTRPILHSLSTKYIDSQKRIHLLYSEELKDSTLLNLYDIHKQEVVSKFETCLHFPIQFVESIESDVFLIGGRCDESINNSLSVVDMNTSSVLSHPKIGNVRDVLYCTKCWAKNLLCLQFRREVLVVRLSDISQLVHFIDFSKRTDLIYLAFHFSPNGKYLCCDDRLLDTDSWCILKFRKNVSYPKIFDDINELGFYYFSHKIVVFSLKSGSECIIPVSCYEQCHIVPVAIDVISFCVDSFSSQFIDIVLTGKDDPRLIPDRFAEEEPNFYDPMSTGDQIALDVFSSPVDISIIADESKLISFGYSKQIIPYDIDVGHSDDRLIILHVTTDLTCENRFIVQNIRDKSFTRYKQPFPFICVDYCRSSENGKYFVCFCIDPKDIFGVRKVVIIDTEKRICFSPELVMQECDSINCIVSENLLGKKKPGCIFYERMGTYYIIFGIEYGTTPVFRCEIIEDNILGICLHKQKNHLILSLDNEDSLLEFRIIFVASGPAILVQRVHELPSDIVVPPYSEMSHSILLDFCVNNGCSEVGFFSEYCEYSSDHKYFCCGPKIMTTVDQLLVKDLSTTPDFKCFETHLLQQSGYGYCYTECGNWYLFSMFGDQEVRMLPYESRVHFIPLNSDPFCCEYVVFPCELRSESRLYRVPEIVVLSGIMQRVRKYNTLLVDCLKWSSKHFAHELMVGVIWHLLRLDEEDDEDDEYPPLKKYWFGGIGPLQFQRLMEENFTIPSVRLFGRRYTRGEAAYNIQEIFQEYVLESMFSDPKFSLDNFIVLEKAEEKENGEQ
ncbi:hypothetical protein ADUPG1_012846 [Aduncisulcus paluster]|uniref:Uncharacterized protein n=1 Tax=Aduncisulcus paluster TaxID=2918883 RepID=A0ABQ5K0W1_9EUKA|nr:hypothetical protein ADUPG1_012846 [Aduncisulcus paluster]